MSVPDLSKKLNLIGEVTHARTREQLLAALRSDVDEIIVEGDDAFLQEAERTTERWESSIATMEFGESSVDYGERTVITTHTKVDASSIAFGFAAALVAILLYVLYEEANGKKLIPNVMLLVWAIVGVLAMGVCARIASEAMKTGNKVEVAWRVTGYFSGKLVITKVVKRARKK